MDFATAAIVVIWVFTALTFLFLLLRVYTRFGHLSAYGADDYIILLSFVGLLLYAVFNHVLWQSDIVGYATLTASYEEIRKIGRVALISHLTLPAATALSKFAVAVFFLRLVAETWHKMIMYFLMILVGVTSILWLVLSVVTCVREPLAPPGFDLPWQFCNMDHRVSGILYCFVAATTDLFFCIFPWFFIMKLHMPRREKYIIAGSMSLGVIAAAAGIKRIQIYLDPNPDPSKASWDLAMWSAIELSITMICVSVAACLPLWKVVFRSMGLTSGSRSKRTYGKQQSYAKNRIGLKTFGAGSSNGTSSVTRSAIPDTERGYQVPDAPYPHGHETYIRKDTFQGDNSDEEILHESHHMPHVASDKKIFVTESVRVDRS